MHRKEWGSGAIGAQEGVGRQGNRCTGRSGEAGQ